MEGWKWPGSAYLCSQAEGYGMPVLLSKPLLPVFVFDRIGGSVGGAGLW